MLVIFPPFLGPSSSCWPSRDINTTSQQTTISPRMTSGKSRRSRTTCLLCYIAGVIIFTYSPLILQRQLLFPQRFTDDARIRDSPHSGRPPSELAPFADITAVNDIRRDASFVDVLSISSRATSTLARAQRSTWGSHESVRYFVAVTEREDPDKSCEERLAGTNGTSNVNETIRGYSGFCRKRLKAWQKRNFVTGHFAAQFARYEWLAKKRNPVGWLCAQKRMASSLAAIGRLYRNLMDNGGLSKLPNYLILVDDDTYVNMERFQELIEGGSREGEINEVGSDPNAKVYAGCVVIAAPGQLIQFTSPFGGWGTFWSRGAIERLVAPLHCGNQSHVDASPFERGACSRLTNDGDMISESNFFRNGMSISDLMGNLANVTTEYCMHSDWSVGYFVNFYNISGVRWNGPDAHIGKRNSSWYPDAAQNRLHPLGTQDSYIYKGEGGNCAMYGENCPRNSYVCHYVNETQMVRIHEERDTAPG